MPRIDPATFSMRANHLAYAATQVRHELLQSFLNSSVRGPHGNLD